MKGAVILDIGLVLMLVLSFFGGVRRGLFVAVFGLIGYIGGAIGAMALAPHLLDPTNSPLKRTLLTGLIVLFLAVIGNIIMTRVAGAVRKVILLGPFRLVDSLLGGVVSALSVVLLIWFLATMGNLIGSPSVSSLLKHSAVVAHVEKYMPQVFSTWAKDETGRLVGWFRSTVPAVPKL